MTPEDKFFFDLHGFIHLKGVLSSEEVMAFNHAIDAHRSQIKERLDPDLRNTRAGTPLAGNSSAGRRDLGGMLGWPQPHCQPFREILAHPRLLPYFTDLCGPGYRLDHLPLVISQLKDSEGFHLHGGPLTGNGGFNPMLQYRCVNGDMWNSLLAVSVQLSDHPANAGGFCVVRGSHKINYPVPEAFAHGTLAPEHLYQPATAAGDVILFSEATVHGAMPWKADHERRIVLYRFAAAGCAYGRSYSPQWPAEMLDGLTPLQRAVLEPPYAVRLERPVLKEGDAEPNIGGRSDKKKEFDREVFGTQFF